MAYNIYTTEGLILSHRPLREADRVYSILTRDLGLLRATATGVRKEVSKLRGSLEPLSLSSISLIRGKEYWKLTSAIIERSFNKELEDKKKIRKSLSKVLVLLSGLVQGEDPHPELFDALIPLMNAAEKMEEKHSELLEIILVVRMLFHLGYLSEGDVPEGIVQEELSEALFEKVLKNKKSIISSINEGIDAANLTRR
ncbi:MAG: repair protein RecO, repair protein RecO [Parcubacteria group bacterium]|nr:repair protein RecO, repair protein RecO [Parcubacteria group bacterium]